VACSTVSGGWRARGVVAARSLPTAQARSCAAVAA
jgi:hypothetical protein